MRLRNQGRRLHPGSTPNRDWIPEPAARHELGVQSSAAGAGARVLFGRACGLTRKTNLITSLDLVKLVFPSIDQIARHEDRFGTDVSRRGPGPPRPGAKARALGQGIDRRVSRAAVAGAARAVREGFARLDANEIDAFELGEMILRYEHCAEGLWKFYGSSSWERERTARNVAAFPRTAQGTLLVARWRTRRRGALTLAGGPQRIAFSHELRRRPGVDGALPEP